VINFSSTTRDKIVILYSIFEKGKSLNFYIILKTIELEGEKSLAKKT